MNIKEWCDEKIKKSNDIKNNSKIPALMNYHAIKVQVLESLRRDVEIGRVEEGA